MSVRTDAEAFLRCRRIAVAGVSRNKRDFTRMLFRELLRRGYDVVPVNPAAQTIEELDCYARMHDINPPVEAALILTAPGAVETVLSDCVEAGVSRVWIYGILGRSRLPETTLRFCVDHQLDVVPGYCPFMFLPNAGWLHRLHAWVARRMDAEMR